MGSFGIQFINPNSIPRSLKPAENAVSGEFVCNGRESDGFLQKSLAYSSYYTLVFVTICAFMPSTIANAATVIAGITS